MEINFKKSEIFKVDRNKEPKRKVTLEEKDFESVDELNQDHWQDTRIDITSKSDKFYMVMELKQ